MPEIIPSKTSHWHSPDRRKTCIMCGEEKALEEFSAYAYTAANGKKSTRYESRCKPCNRIRRRDRYKKSGDKDRATSLAWKDRNRDRLRKYSRDRQMNDPEYRRLKAKAQRKRSARIKCSADKDPSVDAIYDEAVRLEAQIQICPVFDVSELGKKLHVDHIIPIAAGGPHIASNLQILPAGINMRKGSSCLK